MTLNSVVSSSKEGLAVISGGSRGIGVALIREFASKGYAIATYGRNEQALGELKKKIEQEFKVPLYYTVTDAQDKDQVKSFGKFCLSLPYPVKVLIHNAGQFLPGNLMEEKEGTLSYLLSVNLESAYELSRILIPSMKTTSGGHVITICSVASLKPYPQGGSYAISKAALMSFSQNLREELKPHGIKVTAVYPGATWTDSWASAGFPEDRFIPVEDLAKVIWSCHDLSDRTVVEEILLRPQLGDL